MAPVHRLGSEGRARLVARIDSALRRRADVLFAVVFGSFLAGEAFRDIDAAIWTTAAAGRRPGTSRK
jgi:predicted nucleotidyltransferase